MNRLLWTLAILLPITGGCEERSDRFTVGFMPKLVGIPYFNGCKKGAEEAARELGIDLRYDGPTEADSNKQNDLLAQWVALHSCDCLAVACNDPDLVARKLQKARRRGIPVVTYDADTRADARAFFVNMATYDAVAEAMVDALAEQLDLSQPCKVGILTSSIQAPNQSEWAKRIKAYARRKYPNMVLLPEEEHGEDRDRGIIKARALIEGQRDLQGIIGLTSVAVPAAAEAVRQKEKQGQIKVTGVSTPRDMREYVLDGTVHSFILWSPVDLGYLTVHVAYRLHQGTMPENGTIEAGRLGRIRVKDREVLLGKPIRFDRYNIDKFDF
jgi:rhamnose transport system substrate-binding protein